MKKQFIITLTAIALTLTSYAQASAKVAANPRISSGATDKVVTTKTPATNPRMSAAPSPKISTGKVINTKRQHSEPSVK